VSEDAGLEPRTVGTLATLPNLAHTVVPIAAHFLSTLNALISSREQIGLFVYLQLGHPEKLHTTV
jgi:hypothetical protein